MPFYHPDSEHIFLVHFGCVVVLFQIEFSVEPLNVADEAEKRGVLARDR